MMTPNTLTYQRWLDLYAAPATSLTISYGAGITGQTGVDTSADAYTLDLSSGSYAVETHDWSKQLTTERWHDAIRCGSRDAASREPAEWELAGAL